jgi:NADPH2:quinone reductase
VLLKGIHILGFQFIDFSQRHPDFRRNEDALMELLDTDRVTPHIGATFGLDEAATALRLVADGAAVGKVVLAIGGDCVG